MKEAGPEHFVVAIDGVSGSGKSTTAREVARRLGLRHVDTGAMYRVLTFLALEKGLSASDAPELAGLAREADMRFTPDGRLLSEGRDVSQEIRSPQVSAHVSDYCQAPEVRRIMAGRQRELGLEAPSVVEGRDIGTVVFPDAEFKFFMTASSEVRARRRLEDLRFLSPDISLEEIRGNIELRDLKDSSRDHAPLQKAPDAVEIDTSHLTFERQVAIITDLVQSRRSRTA